MTGGRVVVLGPTGRNFAAGMSGGIAFVLDPNGEFPDRCNQEIVDLEDPTDEDFADVRALVEEHRERTGSTVAQRVLDKWDDLKGAWVKVMPMDYKRALRELAERQAIEAGSPAIVEERGDGTGAGGVEAGQVDTYVPAGDGHEEARRPGQAGQHEDAAAAAERAGQEARKRGATDGERAQIEEEAEEEVLPSHG
jgi:hypothetical protein